MADNRDIRDHGETSSEIRESSSILRKLIVSGPRIPKLTSIDSVAIKNFLKAWREYEKQVGDQRDVEGIAVSPVSIESCVSDEVLEGFLDLHEDALEEKGILEVGDFRSEELLAFLKSLVKEEDLIKVNPEEVTRQLRQLAKGDNQVDSMVDRISGAYVAMMGWIRRNGLLKYFKSGRDWNAQPACEFSDALINGVSVDYIQKRIKHRCKYEPDLRQDPKQVLMELKDLLSSYDLHYKEVESHMQRKRGHADGRVAAGAKGTRREDSRPKGGDQKGTPNASRASKGAGKPGVADSQDKSSSDRRERRTCSHCGKWHPSDKCWFKYPHLRPQEKDQSNGGNSVRNNAGAKPRSGPASGTRSQTSQNAVVTLDQQVPSSSSGGQESWSESEPKPTKTSVDVTSLVYDGEGMQFVPVVSDGTALLSPVGAPPTDMIASTCFLLDTGASATTITRAVLQDLQSAYPDRDLVEKVEDPLELRVANGEITWMDEITVPLNITLNTKHGLVTLNNQRCYISGGSESEVGDKSECSSSNYRQLLLGRASCLAMGLDVQGRLERNVKSHHSGKPRLGQHAIMMMAESTEARDMEAEVQEEESYEASVDLLEGDEELELAVQKAWKQAREAGMPSGPHEKLWAMLRRYMDVFRVSLGKDPPADVEPLRVTLRPGYEPCKARARRYKPEALEWMRGFVEDLEANGLIYPNPQSVWASPAMPVAKPGGGYRMVVDLRGVNRWIEPIPYPIPNLESIAGAVRGMKCFAVFDLFKGYWQYGLEESCQEYFTFVTPFGLYTPTRVPQGSAPATSYFQGQTENALRGLVGKTCLVYVDDIIVFAATPGKLVVNVQQVLERLAEKGVKLSAKKAILFADEVKWCGKILSGSGVSQDPERIGGLLELRQPTTIAELMSFLCSVNWMRLHIPELTKIVAPFRTCCRAT